MKSHVDYSVYLVTDRKVLGERDFCATVEQAVSGGVTLVQLREKNLDSLAFYREALQVKEFLREKHIPLIINDRVDIALAVDADGVHVGQSDLPAAVVREMIGAEKILGVSARNTAEAVQAEQDGADYIGVGAMFLTATKTDAELVTLDELKAIRQAVRLPIVLIGGIDSRTVRQFPVSLFDGAAVVSAIFGQADIQKAAAEMLKAVQFCRSGAASFTEHL